MVVSNILYDFLWISHNNKENSDIYTLLCYRSHLLLNKWWDWWSKLIHIGCKAGSACSGCTLKMVLANALHGAL